VATKLARFVTTVAMLLSIALCAGCASQQSPQKAQYNCVENMNDYHCTGMP
jgi:hypothetical protein